jgi:RNA polymerase sigma-70 factor (ECF subfamily)
MSSDAGLEAAGARVAGKAAAAARLKHFNSLCGSLRRDLYRFTFWLTRDPTLAEDVVQETLLRAWNSFDSLTDERAARAWLLTIARREAARVFDRRRPSAADIAELIANDDPALAAPEVPDLADVRREILDLDDIYREPLVLQVLFGYTTLEIAELMQINQATVLTRLHRAREKLRLKFGPTDTDIETPPAAREAG